MIPVGPLVWGIIALVRALSRNGNAPSASSRTDPRRQNLVLRVIGTIFVFPFVLVFTKEEPAIGWTLVTLLVPVMFPVIFTTRVLVPLGLPRVAYYFAWLTAPPYYFLERRGAAVLFGVLAAIRSRRPDPETLDFLEGRLLLEGTAREATVAAAGLLAAARGKLEAARLLLASVDGLPGHALARVPRRMARSWLVADAARRGLWRDVVRLGRRPGSYERWPHAMAAFGERLARAPGAPPNAWLVVLWLVAPHRRTTLPVLRRALATPRTPRGAPDPVTTAAVPDGLVQTLDVAVRAHADCLRAPSARCVAASAAAWDAVRAGKAGAASVARRALVLGARVDVESAMARLVDAVEADLAAFVDVVPAATVESSVTLRGAASRARACAHDDVQTAADSLRDRTIRKIPLDIHGEWLAWASLRAPWERLCASASVADRRAVFAFAHPAACNYAVWLFNARTEKLLANTVFRWLLEEAHVVGDTAAVLLLTRNVDAGNGT
jgi:hypothetical protein